MSIYASKNLVYDLIHKYQSYIEPNKISCPHTMPTIAFIYFDCMPSSHLVASFK